MEIATFPLLDRQLEQLSNLTHLEIDNAAGNVFDIRALPKLAHILIYSKHEKLEDTMLSLLQVHLTGLPKSVSQYLWVLESWYHAGDDIFSDEMVEFINSTRTPLVFIGQYIDYDLKIGPNPDQHFENIFIRGVENYYAEAMANIRPPRGNIWTVVEEMAQGRQDR
jgi:hypothetical protein